MGRKWHLYVVSLQLMNECVAVLILSVCLCATVRDGFYVDNIVEKISLMCPITFKKITIPARGRACKHVQVECWTES